MNCRVVIDRGAGAVIHFDGTITGETTTHYLVTTPENEVGEWFAKRSPGSEPKVHVSIYGQQPNIARG